MKRLLSYIVLLLAFYACSRSLDVNGAGGEGGVRLSLSFVDDSKAVVSDDIKDSCVMKIYKADFSGMVRKYAYKDIPSEIVLPVGSYRMDVLAGEGAKDEPDTASWNSRSFKGSSPFSIEAGKTLELAIVAGVSNVITTVNFDATVDEYFKDGYTFTIGLDKSDSTKMLIYDAEQSGKDGYFILYGDSPKLYWTFSGELKKGGKIQKSGQTSKVEKAKRYTITPKYTSLDGFLSFDLTVDLSTRDFDDMIVFEPTGTTGLVESEKWEIWAGHATIHAEVDESEFADPSKIKFSISENGGEWKSVDSERKDVGAYSAKLTGLKADTDYQYKLVIDGNVIGESLTFHTDLAKQLPNWGFETHSNAESSNYDSFYDPASSDPELQTKFWDSGSSASAGLLGKDYAICFSDTDVPAEISSTSTRSARLQSVAISIVGKLAAGNIFTGEFAGVVGTKGGKVNFGRPWSGYRPTAVRFWYKYYGGDVDYTGGPLPEGAKDECSVKFAIGTWGTVYGGTPDCPVQVNTTDESTFWDYSKLPETIAYVEFTEKGTGSLGPWKQVTLPLEYYKQDAFPTHVVVSGAACKYGDYFNGCSESKLYLDNIEFLYE